MFEDFWRTFYEPVVIAAFLLVIPALFNWSINRFIKCKSPSALGLHIVEDLPTQISIRIGQPGNLFYLKSEGPIGKRLVLDLNRMEDSSRDYVLYLIKLAGKRSGSEIINLGGNVYSVQGSFVKYLPSDSEGATRQSI